MTFVSRVSPATAVLAIAALVVLTSVAPAQAVSSTSITPGVVTISGDPKVGVTLTADVGSWSPDDVTFAYKWYRSGTAVVGATQPTYLTTAADYDSTLKVKVTGTTADHSSKAALSAATPAIGKGTLTPFTVTVLGTLTVGGMAVARLSAMGPGIVSYHFQWYRDGVLIPKATGATFIPKYTSFGMKLTVTATAKKGKYTTISALSNESEPVGVGTFVEQSPPIVSGTAKVGKTFTAYGEWKPATGTYTYQWLRKVGDADPVAIPGATKSTYLLTADDKGTTISVFIVHGKTDYVTVSDTSEGRFIAS